ncbi:hypothetical protein FRC03_004243 [Tulasnella sp. 419]|nr:hypothetical protein FRC03_004243 [Tulasnella sp. 419]
MASSQEAAAAVINLAEEDLSKGAAVHTFDPDASPDSKAATAGKAATALKPITGDAEAQAISVDGAASGPLPPPTITIEDVDKAVAKEEDEKATAPSPTKEPEVPAGEQGMPGAIKSEPYKIPDWYKVGWRQATGVDNPSPTPVQRDHETLAAWVNEMYYGQWYHNAAIIIFAVAATHILTLLRLGWGWLFIILATCATYYSTSIERVRRRARDDIQRELIKTRLATEHESADWLNNFLDRFWVIYEPVLSATIISSVDQILSVSTPAFLDSIRLTTFTLGTKAPRIDKVRTFPRTPQEVVLMDWSVKFTPNDLTNNIKPEGVEARMNPKIVLSIRVGKGVASTTIPILLEDMSFEGHMRIKLKLMSNFPHVQVVEMSFIEKPIFDYVLKPLGGDTFGFDINTIPGLATFIRDMVHATLAPLMYDPNVFTLNLEQLLSGAPIDAATGVLQVHVISAKNLKGSKIGGGSLDPYVSLSINGRAELAKTKLKSNTYNPHWSSTHFLLLKPSNMTESLTLTIKDHNEHRRDTDIGTVSFELQALQEDATQENIIREVLKDGKERGEILFDVSYFPALKPKIVDGKPEPLPESNVGICRLVVHQAKELDGSRTFSNDVNAHVKVFLSGANKPHHITNTYKHSVNPVWESPTEFLVPNKKASTVTIKVIDAVDFGKDPMIGYLTVRLGDLLESTKQHGTQGWFPLSGCKSGRLRLSAEWKPLDMAGSLQGAGSYVPPIGIIRLWLKKATDLKNVEAALGGKSDPYVRVLLNGVIKSRTDVVNNNLSPEWDQIIYVPVHSLREVMLLNIMDYQNLTKDRSLGTVELKVADLAKEDPETKEYPFASTGRQQRKERVELDKGTYKGTLEFEAEFVPSLNLKGLEFHEKNELEKAVDKGNHSSSSSGGDDSDSDVPSGDEESVSSSDEEHHEVPEGVTYKVPKKHKHHHNGHGHTRVKSTDTTATTATAATTNTVETVDDSKGVVEMSVDELMEQQSGIIILDVKSGTLAKKARLEVLLDDSYWPAFSTEKSRSTNAKWDQVGEGFIKELDFSRSQVKKKTLTPVWNESFSAPIPSRVAASFELEVFDWNQIEQAKSLGTGKIDLAELEPFQATEKSIPLISNKHGEKGEIRVRMVFQPEFIMKTRKNTSTFSTAGRAMTQIGSVPFGAGRGVVHGVGTVGKKAKGLFGRSKTLDEEDETEAPEPPSGQVSAPVGSSDGPNALPVENTAVPPGYSVSPGESGVLRVVVVSAKDLSLMGESSVKPYLVLKSGKEEFKTKHAGKTLSPQWDETFTVPVGPDTKSFNATIYDHKTLGKDKTLGEADIDIWRHIQPNGPNPITAADVKAELRQGTGILHLRLEFEKGEKGLSVGHHPRTASISSVKLGGSPSRFSLSRRNLNGTDD